MNRYRLIVFALALCTVSLACSLSTKTSAPPAETAVPTLGTIQSTPVPTRAPATSTPRITAPPPPSQTLPPSQTPPPTPSPTVTVELPPSASLEVPPVKQTHNLTCESASVCSLMRYMGYPCVSDMVVYEALPQSYDNPHRGFVGPPTSPPGSLPPGAVLGEAGGGYGAYVEVIGAALDSLEIAHDYTYNATQDQLKALLAQEIPVLVVVTNGLWVAGNEPVTFVPTDGDGEEVTVIRHQHTYVLTAYDANGFTAINPWGGDVERFSYARFDEDWARFGRQALWIYPRW